MVGLKKLPSLALTTAPAFEVFQDLFLGDPFCSERLLQVRRGPGPTHLNFSPETDYHFDSYRAVWQDVSGCFIAVWSKFHLFSGKLSITWLVSRLL